MFDVRLSGQRNAYLDAGLLCRVSCERIVPRIAQATYRHARTPGAPRRVLRGST
jgi:hypothetical protein